ncbi:MAG TPA: helix-turn-helix domain-containing protein, partial [Acidimicrobiia bacterium]|nr:helix-turn-helix domain-containing protein [Acidimicrobiia bacterium]
MTKTYGQFCGLARALDHIGDRWTLLVVRELLVAPARYGDLLGALEGVPTNLLADRLRQLEADGLVVREHDPGDRRRTTYRLTPLGLGLEPALLALIRWGAHWMRTGPEGDRLDPGWLLLALRALLGERTAGREGTVEVRVGDGRLRVTGERGARIRVERGSAPRAGAVVYGHPAPRAGAVVDGDPALL